MTCVMWKETDTEHRESGEKHAEVMWRYRVKRDPTVLYSQEGYYRVKRHHRIKRVPTG